MKKRCFLFALVLLYLIKLSCYSQMPNVFRSSILLSWDTSHFNTVIDGKRTHLFILSNKKGMWVAITDYGGRIVGLSVPDKMGRSVDVVVGMSSVEAYKNATEPYFGALVGRVGNRIAKGRFVLDGVQHRLSINNLPNTLHGGIVGYQYRVWNVVDANDSTLRLNYLSPDGDQGFPGKLDITVTYKCTASNALQIEYDARADHRTLINLTSHAFFNLNGEGNGNIYGHRLWIHANSYTPVDSMLIPTGRLSVVKGTPFDFRKFYTIGSRLDTNTNQQLRYGKGYDHNYVLNKNKVGAFEKVASVIGDLSGIRMVIYTDQPGLQFYSGNFMSGRNIFKYGNKDIFRTAFALETQHFPDAIHHSNFPSIIINPGERYHSVTAYVFYIN